MFTTLIKILKVLNPKDVTKNTVVKGNIKNMHVLS